MPKKAVQRVTPTRRLLQEGLLALLEKKSLHDISVTELCQVSGINRSTFYHHYASPEEVLADMVEQIIGELSGFLIHLHTPEEAQQNLENVCCYFRDHARQMNAVIQCSADGELIRFFGRSYICYRNDPSQQENGEVEESLRLTVTFLSTGCYFMLREWLTSGMKLSPGEVAALGMKIISREYW